MPYFAENVQKTAFSIRTWSKLTILGPSKLDRKTSLNRTKMLLCSFFWLFLKLKDICEISWKNYFFDTFLKKIWSQNTDFWHFCQMHFLLSKWTILNPPKMGVKSLYLNPKWIDFRSFDSSGNPRAGRKFLEKQHILRIFPKEISASTRFFWILTKWSFRIFKNFIWSESKKIVIWMNFLFEKSSKEIVFVETCYIP